jgi:uncharacterized membrane protein (DUF373 family)
MSSGETTDEGPSGVIEQGLARLVDVSETAMEVLELITGIVLVFMFAIGLYDLVAKILDAVRSGAAFEVSNVVGFIDTVLLLRIIIDASLVAIARKVIGFRPDEYATTTDLLVNTVAIAVLLIAVIVAFYVVRKTMEAPTTDTPAAGSVTPATADGGTADGGDGGDGGTDADRE